MEDNKFRFSYSAPTKTERQEIEDIRKDYLAPVDRDKKLEEVRTLDDKVKNTPTGVAITVGVVGTLIFGLGLTCILEWELFVLGVIISVIGSAIIGFTHYIYVKIKHKLTEKYKDRILLLSEELLNEYDVKNLPSDGMNSNLDITENKDETVYSNNIKNNNIQTKHNLKKGKQKEK